MTHPARLAPSLAALALACLALASACAAVGPDYEAPAGELSAAWREPPTADGAAELADWWRQLEDPLLDQLVARALEGSLDLRAALARVAESRALRGAAAGERWPSVDGRADFQRTGQSENTVFGAFVPDADEYSLGFDAAWELDLFGRVRRSVEAATADLEASVEDLHDAAVTVAAEVARNYVELRGFQRRLELARGNLALQEETLTLVRGRHEAGLTSEGDVAQARTNLASTRAALPRFEVGLRAAENRLAVLLGETPGALAAELGTAAPIPVPPRAVAVGVPADLLRRRADVRRAERVLAAETARIGVAEADLYPRLALLGNLGLAAEEASDLFDHASTVFGLGPSLRWNLFDGGRRRNFVAAQEARTEQALVNWELTLLLALEEAENAMTAFVREDARRTALSEACTQAGRAVELARTQYVAGLSDFQNVLVSERALAELEDALAESDTTRATSLIQLYKALGGGWDEGEGMLAVLGSAERPD